MPYLDGLRGLAIVAMVVNHTGRWWIDRSFGWPRYHLIYITTTVAAPIFLFLVGFCQAIAHHNATVRRGQSFATVAPATPARSGGHPGRLSPEPHRVL